MRCFGCQILFLLFSFTSTADSKYHYNVCNNAIGFENGEIKNEQLSASSYRSYLFVRDKGTFNAEARFGRLNGALAWCGISPSKRYNRPSPYFQVDFRRAVNVSGLATQGLSSTFSLYFVKSYAIKFSLDGNLWFDYSSPNKVWLGNNDTSTIRRVYFDKPVLANYLRIYPLAYSYRICLRAEIYGCYANGTGSSTQPTDMFQRNNSQPAVGHVTHRVSTTPSPTMKEAPSHMTRRVSTTPSPTMKEAPSHMTRRVSTTTSPTMKEAPSHMTRRVSTTTSPTMTKAPSSKPNVINSSLPLGVEQSHVLLVTLSPSSGGMPPFHSVQSEKMWMERKSSVIIVVVCIGFVMMCILLVIIFLVWRRKQRSHVCYSDLPMLPIVVGVAEGKGSYKVVAKFV